MKITELDLTEGKEYVADYENFVVSNGKVVLGTKRIGEDRKYHIWTSIGEQLTNSNKKIPELDFNEPIDWDSVEIGTPIWVRLSGNAFCTNYWITPWEKKYFSGRVLPNAIYAYSDGDPKARPYHHASLTEPKIDELDRFKEQNIEVVKISGNNSPTPFDYCSYFNGQIKF